MRQGDIFLNTADMDAEGASGSRLQGAARLLWNAQRCWRQHCARDKQISSGTDLLSSSVLKKHFTSSFNKQDSVKKVENIKLYLDMVRCDKQDQGK